jgi:hypothetical protein
MTPPSVASNRSNRSIPRVREVFLVLILALVASVRFDYRDPGPVRSWTAGARAGPYGHPIDVEGYVRLTRYFRAEAPADSMISPFCFRPLVPLLAALLPLRPLTAIDLINLLALAAALLVVLRACSWAGLPPGAAWVGGVLFAVSFPTFYYATIGFVDPVAVLAAAILLLLTLKRAGTGWLIVAAIAAVLVKESNAAFAALPLAGAWLRGRRSGSELAAAAAPLVLSIGAVVATRGLLPFPDPGYAWTPSAAALRDNLLRPRTYASACLTAGVPALLAIGAIARGRWKEVLGGAERSILLAGASIALALYGYSFTAAYTDGRILWVGYPFVVPIAATWFAERPGDSP